MDYHTVELRHVLKEKYIFNFDYDFYNESRRRTFEENFIRHFYFREIGTYPIDRFILHLEDKMKTVFPYYNELFKTTEVEYSILDNYDIRETTTMKRDNIGLSSGVSSTVGQMFDNQVTSSTVSREGSVNETGNSETVGTGATTSESSETTIGEGTVSETSESGATQDTTKRFLDTPQGAIDLKDSKYLTTLNQDTAEGTNSGSKDVTTSDEKTATANGGTTSNDTQTTNSSRGVDESSTDNTETTVDGTQKTTADNNTRTRSEGSVSETIEHTRKGNIGVDTDADMIQKHIKLQKILTKIEKMFFDECEDLFMLVY